MNDSEYKKQSAVYNNLQNITYTGDIEFRSSHEDIRNYIDKSKYRNGFINKLNCFLRSNFLRYAAGTIGAVAVIVLIFFTVNVFNRHSHTSVPAINSDEDNYKKTAAEFIKN